jgi:hypothetical protein
MITRSALHLARLRLEDMPVRESAKKKLWIETDAYAVCGNEKNAGEIETMLRMQALSTPQVDAPRPRTFNRPVPAIKIAHTILISKEAIH